MVGVVHVLHVLHVVHVVHVVLPSFHLQSNHLYKYQGLNHQKLQLKLHNMFARIVSTEKNHKDKRHRITLL